LGKTEQIAIIDFNTPDERVEDTDDYNEKIDQMKQLNIYDIRINSSIVGNGPGATKDITEIAIYFNNLSKVKNKKEFKEQLNAMIEILKYFKNLKDIGEFNTDIHFFKPDEENFSPEHNEILMYLAYKINPIAPNIDYQHFPSLYQYFPVLNPVSNQPSHFPTEKAQHLNNK
jgi:hypothetical protein